MNIAKAKLTDIGQMVLEHKEQSEPQAPLSPPSTGALAMALVQ